MKRGFFDMAIKLRSTILAFLFLIPALVYVVNTALFDLLMFFAVLYVSGKSLYKLFAYNFLSDEFIEKYESRVMSVSISEFLIRKTFSVLLTVLIAVFFIGKCTICTGIIKYATILVAALWIFDLLKTGYSFLSRKDYSEDYTVFDYVLETLMWLQNIMSIILVFVLTF